MSVTTRCARRRSRRPIVMTRRPLPAALRVPTTAVMTSADRRRCCVMKDVVTTDVASHCRRVEAMTIERRHLATATTADRRAVDALAALTRTLR